VIKRLLVGCLAALALSAEAVDIPFVNAQVDVTAVAVSDGAPGVESQSGPPSPVPVVASAASLGTVSIATAGAIGAPGFLTTSADVSGGGGITNSVGTSHFAGSFLTSAAEPFLSVDFMASSFASGTGDASTSLFLSLTSGGVVLFNDFVTGPSVLTYLLTPGATNLLDLTLTSEASAGFPAQGTGNASSFGQVAFTSAVPLPAPLLLLLVGLGPVAAMTRRKRLGSKDFAPAL
jgi:hypothetical protein